MDFENYIEEKHTIDLMKANAEAIKYYILFTLIFLLPYYLIWRFNGLEFIKSENRFIRIFGPFFAIILGIIIHEFVHGIFFAKYASKGFKSIKFGVLWIHTVIAKNHSK